RRQHTRFSRDWSSDVCSSDLSESMSKFYYNQEQGSYDAIVVGTGISGGWAAKELCENGLKTLVLERGPMVRHRDDYPTANLDPWDFPHAGRATREELKQQEKQ